MYFKYEVKINMYVCIIYVCMYVCMYVPRMYVCMYICVYIHTV